MAMESNIWRNLPNELLHLVFAHLHVAGIGQLRVLSKEWKANVDCKNSEFNQVLDATAHLNMFTLISWRVARGISIPGNICDIQANRWHVYDIDVVLGQIVGADGGLMCCVLQQYNIKSLSFIVMNPLTKKMIQLPPLLSVGVEKTNTQVIIVRMVKLTMDRKTKEYKVFAVCFIQNGGQGFFAQVYDSHIKEWTFVKATQGHIIGWEYIGLDSNCGMYFRCSVYNCANGTIQYFNRANIALELKVQGSCCVLLEDHLFVLHKEAFPGPADLLEDDASMLQKYSISEFYFPENASAWVKLEVHNCGPCKCFYDTTSNISNLKLWGCHGFLLVYGGGSKHAGLYNLSTREWRNLPTFIKPLDLIMICEINWSAIV